MRAALIVRAVRGWANDMAMAAKEGQDTDVVLPMYLEHASDRAFRSTSPGSSQDRMPPTCSDLRDAMGTLRHEVLAAMRRWMDR